MYIYTGHPGEDNVYTSGTAAPARRILVSQSVDIEAFPEKEAVNLLLK